MQTYALILFTCAAYFLAGETSTAQMILLCFSLSSSTMAFLLEERNIQLRRSKPTL